MLQQREHLVGDCIIFSPVVYLRKTQDRNRAVDEMRDAREVT